MGLIEDAKEIVEAGEPTGEMDQCFYCDQYGTHETKWRIAHTPTCPWLAMPRIVRVLEAAQQLLDYSDIPGTEYVAKYGRDHDWWTEWQDLPFVQKLREAMRDAP